MGQRLRVITLIWSRGEAEAELRALFIIEAISLYVGGVRLKGIAGAGRLTNQVGMQNTSLTLISREGILRK